MILPTSLCLSLAPLFPASLAQPHSVLGSFYSGRQLQGWGWGTEGESITHGVSAVFLVPVTRPQETIVLTFCLSDFFTFALNRVKFR